MPASAGSSGMMNASRDLVRNSLPEKVFLYKIFTE